MYGEENAMCNARKSSGPKYTLKNLACGGGCKRNWPLLMPDFFPHPLSMVKRRERKPVLTTLANTTTVAHANCLDLLLRKLLVVVFIPLGALHIIEQLVHSYVLGNIQMCVKINLKLG